ncbi:unnamed protein product [Mycena citricolor]|uniref:F-box domain-containing protein n=1 Tax=Mycena citricolor TaxID=2018698 RepID=A0AAD2GWM1_9AGAR|nr:unnamed protein product [Mycena citricolor]
MKNHLSHVVDKARNARFGGRRRRNEGMDTASKLLLLIPPELWLQVFSHLSSSFADLKSVSLVCDTFRVLAQPLLFARIAIYPNFSHTALPPLALRYTANKSRKKAAQRLDFFTSPGVAPAVRECLIYPPAAEEDAETSIGSRDDVLDAAFDSLRKFPNLRTLECRTVRLTVARLTILHALPQLSGLSLDSCVTDEMVGLSPLALSQVTVRSPETSCTDFSVILSPVRLRRLIALTNDIAPALSDSGRFGKLKYLELPALALTSPQIATALAQCPAVERMVIHVGADGQVPRTGVPTAFPPTLMPNLKFYRGPRNFALLFASTGLVATIEISTPAKAHRLTRTFRSLRASPLSVARVEYLSFRVDGPMPATFLRSVHRVFPALRSLSINDPAVSATDLLGLLAHSSPKTSMRLFRMRIEGKDRYNLWVPPVEEAEDVITCFGRLKSELERVYPGLSALRLMYGLENGSVLWKKPSSGTTLEQLPIHSEGRPIHAKRHSKTEHALSDHLRYALS